VYIDLTFNISRLAALTVSFIRILVLASRGAKFIEDCISLSLHTARQMLHVAPQLKCECSVPFSYVILDGTGTVHPKQKCEHCFLDLPVHK